MARSMQLDVIVRMRDLLTGPLRRLRSGLQGIADFAKKIGVVGTAIAGISFMGPIQQAAAFQQQLLDISLTAGKVGTEAFASVDEMRGKFLDLAIDVGQSSRDIAAAAGGMIAAGLDQSLVDESIGTIGRAATAAHASIDDMAAVSTSLLQTLKLPSAQLYDALGGLVVAGKEGAFELKDMARYFPTLTGQMAKFGVTGREAVNTLGAALQIARKGTSDPAEAANNLKNFLSKILAPETVKKFQEAGVDIEAVMRDAATKGINPIEAVLQKVVRLTGLSNKEVEGFLTKAKKNGLEGADALEYVREQLIKIHGAGKLGSLFGDMQVMDFVIPFLANIDEYKRIKDEVAKATGAAIDPDFETQMLGLNQQLTIFREIGFQAVDEVGLAFGTWLPLINDSLATSIRWVRQLNKDTGGMVRQGIAFAGAAILIAAGLGALGVILPIIGAGFGALAALIGPIGIALAGIALAGKYVYDNWADIAPGLAGIWSDARVAALDAWGAMERGGSRLMAAGGQLADRYGPMVRAGIGDAWQWARGRAQAAWQAISTAGPGLLAAAREFVGRYGPMVRLGIGDAWQWARGRAQAAWQAISAGGPALLAAGQDLVDRYGPMLRDGLTAAWDDIKSLGGGFKTFFEGFSRGLESVDLSGLTIDETKLAGFRALDTALAGIAAGWGILRDFGAGFGRHLDPIGESLGGLAAPVASIADSVLRLVGAFGRLLGFASGDGASFAMWLGDKFGGALRIAADAVEALANGIAKLLELMANLAEGKFELPSISLPEMPTFGGIKSYFGVGDGASGPVIPGVDSEGLNRALNPVNRPANDNGITRQSDPAVTGLPGRGFAPPQASEQKVTVENDVNVGGRVSITVDGPGRVTGVTSDNPAVPVTAAPVNTGRTIGRF